MYIPPGTPRSRSFTRLTIRVSLPHLGQAVDLVVSMTFLRSAVFAIFAIFATFSCRNVPTVERLRFYLVFGSSIFWNLRPADEARCSVLAYLSLHEVEFSPSVCFCFTRWQLKNPALLRGLIASGKKLLSGTGKRYGLWTRYGVVGNGRRSRARSSLCWRKLNLQRAGFPRSHSPTAYAGTAGYMLLEVAAE
jgi:hypothetical protein